MLRCTKRLTSLIKSKRQYHISSRLFKNEKLRKNRRHKKYTNEIISYLSEDLNLRKIFVQEGMEVNEKIHPLLREQIERDFRDPKIQNSFSLGGTEKKKIIDYYYDLGTRISDLKKIKDLETKVIEEEKRVKIQKEKKKETAINEDKELEMFFNENTSENNKNDILMKEQLFAEKYKKKDIFEDDFLFDDVNTNTNDVQSELTQTENIYPTYTESQAESVKAKIIPQEEKNNLVVQSVNKNIATVYDDMDAYNEEEEGEIDNEGHPLFDDEIDDERFNPLPIETMREIRERQRKGREIPKKMAEEFERLMGGNGLDEQEYEAFEDDEDMGTPMNVDFITAVRRLDLHALNRLCESEQGKSLDGEGPLHIAAILESPECIEALLKQRVDVNSTSKTGTTPFHMAAMRGDIPSMKVLVSNGAYLNPTDDDGLSPLHLAISSAVDIEALNYMIDVGCSLNQQDYQGMSPLHIAAELGDPNILKFLISKGANLNTLTTDRESPLHLAALKGNIECVEVLLEEDPDCIDLMDKFGSSPLHYAIKKGHHDIVKVLLQHGADIHIKDASDSTPMHYAAMLGHLNILKILVAYRGYVNERNEEGWTPLHLAAQGGHLSCVEFLYNNGALTNVRNDDGVTPLLLSLSQRHIEIAKRLIQWGADINIGDSANFTPLMAAIQANESDLALYMISKGVNVNARTADNETAFHMALDEGLLEVADALFRKGVNIKLPTIEGFQPIHFATSIGSIEWVNILVQSGANPNAITRSGLTPLKIAQERGNAEMERKLKELGAVELDVFTYIDLKKKGKLVDDMNFDE